MQCVDDDAITWPQIRNELNKKKKERKTIGRSIKSTGTVLAPRDQQRAVGASAQEINTRLSFGSCVLWAPRPGCWGVVRVVLSSLETGWRRRGSAGRWRERKIRLFSPRFSFLFFCALLRHWGRSRTWPGPKGYFWLNAQAMREREERGRVLRAKSIQLASSS